MARSYKRDKLGRFASTGSGGGSAAGAANSVRKTKRRLADDDAASDRRWARRETAKLDAGIKQAKSELAALKQPRATASSKALDAQRGRVSEARKSADAAAKRAADVKAKNAAERKARAASLGMTEAQYMAKYAPKPKAKKGKK